MHSCRYRSLHIRKVVARKHLLVLAAGFLCLQHSLAEADNHEIDTRGNQWRPIVLFIESGDTVTWLGMSGHETELMEGMAPLGSC